MKKVTTNITFGQVLFILLTLVFSSAMFFYLGAKFGRQVLNIAESGSDHEQPLLPDEKVSEEIKKILSGQQPQLTFHDVLSTPAKVVSVASPQEPILKSTPPASPIIAKTQVKTKTALVVETGLLDDQSSVLQEEPQQVIVAPQKQYRLQVGSFADEKKAQTAKTVWQARGYTVSMTSTQIPDKGTWFKLYVGGFTTLDDVQAAQKKIQNQYKQSAMILE